jgi:hypothetical protein
VLSSAFNDILRLYGTSVPQLSLLVAVVLGSVGFNEYFNPGAWTAMAVLSFALVYLFRRQISPRLSKAATIALFILLIFLAPPVVFFLILHPGIGAFIRNNVFLCSSYASISTTIPLAILLVGYRKQEERFGMVFPEPLNGAIYERLAGVSFYKSNVLYDVRVTRTNDSSVVLEMEYSYVAFNRTNEPTVWFAGMDPKDPNMEVLEAVVEGQRIPTDDPVYKTGRGLEIKHEIPPKSGHSFKFHIRARYNLLDSELFTTYSPATDLTLNVTNGADDLTLSFDTHYDPSPPVHAHKDDSRRTSVRLDRGLLPYQGVRMKWMPKGG